MEGRGFDKKVKEGDTGVMRGQIPWNLMADAGPESRYSLVNSVVINNNTNQFADIVTSALLNGGCGG